MMNALQTKKRCLPVPSVSIGGDPSVQTELSTLHGQSSTTSETISQSGTVNQVIREVMFYHLQEMQRISAQLRMLETTGQSDTAGAWISHNPPTFIIRVVAAWQVQQNQLL
jgi:hypothetical protein